MNPNPYCLHFGGYQESFVNLTSSNETVVGLYNRMKHQNEKMSLKLNKYKHRLNFQDFLRQQDLLAYTKHYDKFIEYKNKLYELFKPEEVIDTLSKSHKNGWREEMESWDKVKTPKQVAALPIPKAGQKPFWDGDELL